MEYAMCPGMIVHTTEYCSLFSIFFIYYICIGKAIVTVKVSEDSSTIASNLGTRS